ncbi:tRNA 2-thiouridine(34) synthase MnmA [Hominifimenecus sp. rT4P-3]|uniref:tRNA 2-thiouridine(34) synthase MnmA n=1 Tax=Hominifimenecus sp. rT4P-3 TaxID=3242979 RepID=UPI003DA43048
MRKKRNIDSVKKEKIVIGMSGGVDSSVAAWLLKEQGYDVIGVTMETWENDATGEKTCGSSAVLDARGVADVLGIPHYTVDFREAFRRDVIEPFMAAYEAGKTPNPCVACNRKVKWEALLEKAKELGAEQIATGHYARIRRLSNGRYAVERAVSAAKDQTYALYQLSQDQLARTKMPLGEFTKDQVREMAVKAELPVANKPDSQDICFIPDQDYAAFIGRMRGTVPPPGNFVDEKGNVLGRHQGIIHYTIGQRKGLGVAFGVPLFVKEIRPKTNEVVLGNGDEIFSRRVVCHSLCFMGEADFLEPRRVLAKIRYSHKGAMGIVRRIEDDLAECIFDEPVRAVTPGQAIVFYDGDLVLGGGTIQKGE